MPKKVTRDDVEEWRALQDKGYSYARIARETGWTRQTISKYLSNHNKPDPDLEDPVETTPPTEHMITPRQCLETTLKLDPKLGGSDHAQYILEKADLIYDGVLSSVELENMLKELEIDNSVVARVKNNYLSIINMELNKDKNLLLLEDVWHDFLGKEPGAPDPEEVVEPDGDISIQGGIDVRDGGAGGVRGVEDPGDHEPEEPFDVGEWRKETRERFEKIRMINRLASGASPARGAVRKTVESHGGVDVDGVLEKMLNRLMMLRILQEFRG